ncbi:hypothetical protein lacNasYZ03_14730 [Lactobacillus nasalidis]|uniref:Uncharacterized protein n=1 Tax=Lactobacillus nasalidis TaxID=2797258 RepID=A0ABQ3W5F7_9LACO|nr:hypothetical protein lacNasYZ01_16030 [Lactobacillus nasalidis]GHV98887.1 hypothetical protein lacNasYZ02_03170 [Lactobacillus nasalidis]GHW01786.1 hypothetical protein lacNasYZ03_14730 [Lactobacillus nasalidis]
MPFLETTVKVPEIFFLFLAADFFEVVFLAVLFAANTVEFAASAGTATHNRANATETLLMTFSFLSIILASHIILDHYTTLFFIQKSYLSNYFFNKAYPNKADIVYYC